MHVCSRTRINVRYAPQDHRSGDDRCSRGVARRVPSTGLVERSPQPLLGGPFREVAGRWTAPFNPRRPELLLDLATVRKAVLGIPRGTPRSLDPKDMSSGGLEYRSHVSDHYARLGRYRGYATWNQKPTRTQNKSITRNFEEPAFGLEPKTSSLQVKCSTN
jgi:hypothetical protein